MRSCSLQDAVLLTQKITPQNILFVRFPKGLDDPSCSTHSVTGSGLTTVTGSFLSEFAPLTGESG